MNPLHKFMSDINNGGVSVELKRQTEHGILAPVQDKEMKALGTKSRLASTAQLLEKLNPEEKMEWAMETKDEGNQLFAEEKYAEAMEKYVEALAAADFGSKTKKKVKFVDDDNNDHSDASDSGPALNEGNVDELVVPILSNLSACCMRLQQWHKAISFAEQALLLRPMCPKALYRMGKSQLQMAEYKKAKESLLRAKDIMDQHTADTQSEEQLSTVPESYLLSEADYKTIPSLVGKANEGVKKDRQAAENMKKSLQRAFAPPPPTLPPQAPPADPAAAPPALEVLPMSFSEFLVYLMELAFKFFMRMIGVEFKKKKKTSRPVVKKNE
eukprot:gene47304-57946_t